MNSPQKLAISLAVGASVVVGGGIVANQIGKGQVDDRTQLKAVHLTQNKAYISTFKGADGKDFDVPITPEEYNRISTQDYQPQYPNAVWQHSGEVVVFDSGTTTLRDGEYLDLGKESVVKLSGKHQRLLDSSNISNGKLDKQAEAQIP